MAKTVLQFNQREEVLYQALCAMCHVNAKFNSSGDALIEMIAKGQNLIAMPAFGEHLSEDQINSLAEYIEGEKDD